MQQIQVAPDHDDKSHPVEWPHVPSDKTPEQKDLADIEFPLSQRQRRRLRRQITHEVFLLSDERNCLARQTQSLKKCETSSQKVANMLLMRAKAMNPFRNYERLGWGLFGIDPYNLETLVPFSVLSFFCAPILGYLALGTWGAVGGLAIGAFPVFLGTWVGRSIYNLCAGIATAVSAPVLLAAARYKDLFTRPGRLRAATFLKELTHANLGEQAKTELKTQRIDLLDAALREQKTKLQELKDQEAPPAQAAETEIALPSKEDIVKRWLSCS